MMHRLPTILVPCHRFPASDFFSNDKIAHETMLAIDIISGPLHNRSSHNLATVLRMPGADEDLVLGLLYSLGLIENIDDISTSGHCFRSLKKDIDRFIVELIPARQFNPLNFAHAHPRHSSCGFCGSQGLIEDIAKHPAPQELVLNADLLWQALSKLKASQIIFDETGGTHGAGLFSLDGELIALFEDVGRHNALDKLIGHMLKKKALPLNNYFLVMTSRASYEILQKASKAFIPVVAAIGAVSSLAVELAHKNHITLVGFLREGRFNIYSHPERLKGSRS